MLFCIEFLIFCSTELQTTTKYPVHVHKVCPKYELQAPLKPIINMFNLADLCHTRTHKF